MLGEALGVTFQQVQKYEKGANRLSAGRLFRIANLLEVEVSYFFEGLPTGRKLKPVRKIRRSRTSD
jgi:transcriptional regulator with XRE-family HTH domain